MSRYRYTRTSSDLNDIIRSTTESDNRTKKHRGTVKQTDKQCLAEASAYVHRKLGTSRKYSEGDKRDIAAILSSHFISSRDLWTEQMSHTQDELNELEEEHEHKLSLWNSLVADTIQFARVHASQLDSHAHDMMTTTDVLSRLSRAGLTTDSIFIESLERLLDKISKSIEHRDGLNYEREKCFSLLRSSAGLQPEILHQRSRPVSTSQDLDELLMKEAVFPQFDQVLMESEGKNQVIAELEETIRVLEEEVNELQELTNLMESELYEIDMEISQSLYNVQT